MGSEGKFCSECGNVLSEEEKKLEEQDKSTTNNEKKNSLGKSKKIIIGIVFAVVVIGIIIASTSNDSSKKTKNNDIKNASGKVQKSENNSTEEVTTDNIKYENLGLTRAGDLVVKVTNDNNETVCLSEVTANFKDASNNFALSVNSQSSFIVIPSKSFVMIYFWGYDENYSQYPNIEFKTEFAYLSDSFVNKGIELTLNDTGSQLAVTLKNNSGVEISDATVVAIYYQGNSVVGAEDGYSMQGTQNGGEAYINIDYPKDSDYNNVAFDKFEVYYINARKK